MIYIEVDQEVVVFRHDFPFHPRYGLKKTEEELLRLGMLVESIPEPEFIEGKDAVLKFNGEQLYYEYEDIPKTEMEILTSRLEATEQALLQIMMEGMM